MTSRDQVQRDQVMTFHKRLLLNEYRINFQRPQPMRMRTGHRKNFYRRSEIGMRRRRKNVGWIKNGYASGRRIRQALFRYLSRTNVHLFG